MHIFPRIPVAAALSILALFVAVPVSQGQADGSTSPAINLPRLPDTVRETSRPNVEKPAPAAPVEGAAAPAASVDESARKLRFRITKIEFVGNTVLPAASLDALAQPYTNSEISLAQLQELARKAQSLYRSRGYFLTRVLVPAQELSGGAVKLAVSEARFGDIKVDGARHHSDAFVKRFFAPATRRDRLVREGPMTRSLLILNEFKDLHVTTVLERGKAPGTTDVTLKVKDRSPFHVGLDYNNLGNRLVGRNRIGLTLEGGHVFTEGDEVYARGIEAFPTDSKPFIQAGYSAPVGNRGHRASFNYASADTVTGGLFSVLGLNGDARIFSLGYQVPRERTLKAQTNYSAGLVSKRIRNFVFNNTLLSQDDLRELTLAYSGALQHRKARSAFSAQVTQGLGSLFGGVGRGNPRASRVGAGNSFTKLTGDGFHLVSLAPKQTAFFRLNTQLGDGPLPTAEQFGIGGQDSVRGFIPSQFLGDDGYSASGEYRYQFVTKKKASAQAALFLDHGRASLDRPAVGERDSQSLTGAGVGLRASFGRSTTARFDLGFPLSPRRSIQDDSSVLYATVGTRF